MFFFSHDSLRNIVQLTPPEEDLEASSGEAYGGDGLVEPIQLTFVLLKALQGSCDLEDGW